MMQFTGGFFDHSCIILCFYLCVFSADMDKIENNRAKFCNAVQQLVGEGPTQNHVSFFLLFIE